jgi:hypothetical protein
MYSRRASRIKEERLTRARLAAPFVARSNSESNTTWMVSTLWRILHNRTHSQPGRHQGTTAGDEDLLPSNHSVSSRELAQALAVWDAWT